MKKLILLFCLPLLAQVASATVIYTFTGTSTLPPENVHGPFTFTFTSASFIISDVSNILPGPTLTCNACDFISMLPSHPSAGADSRQIAYDFASGTGVDFFYFPPGSFEAPGVYTSILIPGINDGTLTVTSGVPEPNSVSLLMLGAGAVLLLRAGRIPLNMGKRQSYSRVLSSRKPLQRRFRTYV